MLSSLSAIILENMQQRGIFPKMSPERASFENVDITLYPGNMNLQ